ncbi:hypothetical protein PR202_gb00935 [Eleusine coracana subsp. coracana]|uniref:Uncharacterized protein n=1 Tax=Eleusine coracana subsp. coracana TaxID=191504 RepID=A0AAV5DUM5_ELECO|nr:hypothetical protein QOZ80_5BG0423660 [Eleusine coracana subsp. coracana]GJN14150.1 hypothetical protein PR202_gb00935 [Eleusine coracana subsp. coracana]
MPGAVYKGGIKAYWKRRGYDRIDAADAQRRPRLPTAELGDGRSVPSPAPAPAQPPRRRRGWRVHRPRGLGRRVLRALSPRRLLARLRDAYVNAMLRLASSAAVAGYGAGAPYCTAGDPFAPPPRPLVREYQYDEKALVEIYRSILARGEAAPAIAAARMPAVV